MNNDKTHQTHNIEITPKLKEKLYNYTQLHDFYGGLLTKKQNICFTMHYLEDYSLAEIAESLDVTPQAVADQVKRTIKILQKYEESLCLIKKWDSDQIKLNKLDNMVTNLIEKGYPLESLKEIIDEMR